MPHDVTDDALRVERKRILKEADDAVLRAAMDLALVGEKNDISSALSRYSRYLAITPEQFEIEVMQRLANASEGGFER